MSFWIAPTNPRLWEGATVYILGGGPSLGHLNLTPIHGEKVIGVNDAYIFGDWVDAIIFADRCWWDAHRHKLGEYNGMKFTTEPECQGDSDYLSLSRKLKGVNMMPGEIAHNKNTGAMAINLAAILGAKKIILLGFDMKHDADGKPNWHENIREIGPGVHDNYIRRIEKDMAPTLRRMGIEVINACPDSALSCFPKVEYNSLFDCEVPPKGEVAHRDPDFDALFKRCVICDSSDFRLEKIDGFDGEKPCKMTAQVCNVCSGYYQHVKMESESYTDHYKTKYHEGEYTHTYKHDTEVAQKRLEKYQLKPASQILDIGSGNGAFVDSARACGHTAYGVEVAGGAGDNGFVYEQELDAVYFPTDGFDTVTMHDVIEHIPDPKAMLAEVFRVLKQHGKFILDVPAFWRRGGAHHWKLFEHIWFPTQKEVMGVLKDAGFHIHKVDVPVPGKLVFYCTKPTQKRYSLIVPQGTGDIYWVMVKLQDFIKRNNLGMVDVWIQSNDVKLDRSAEYVKRCPFVNFAGYVKMGARDPIFRQAYMNKTKTVFPNVHGRDAFISYNGFLSPRTSQNWEPVTLEDSDQYECNWYPPLFESLEERRQVKQYQEEFGDYIHAYFIPHGMYKQWLSQFNSAKIQETLRLLHASTGKKIILTGAAWDNNTKLMRELSAVKGVVNMTGRTTLPQLFALMRGASGCVGFPSGSTIMGVTFGCPTVMLWSGYFKKGFWWNLCPPDSRENWYKWIGVGEATPKIVADMLLGMMDVGKLKRVRAKKIADMPNTIACVLKTGGDYSAQDVRRLMTAVQKHSTKPFKFVCLTDDPAVDFCDTVKLDHNWPGWWSKMELFRPDLFNGDSILYLDLDTVILDNIDEFIGAATSDANFWMLRDLIYPEKMASGMLAWTGDFSHLYQEYKAKPTTRINPRKGDQEYIAASLGKKGVHPATIQDCGQVASYKMDCRDGVPENVPVVCFHGQPRPHAVEDDWVVENWRNI